MAEVLSQRVQDGFILLSIIDTKFLSVCRKSVKPQYFSSQITEDIVALCYAYYDQFKVAPDNHFQDELERMLRNKSEEDKELYVDYLERISEMEPPQEKYVIEQVNSFIKASEFKSAAIKFAKLVQNGEFQDAKLLMEKALRQGVEKEEVGINYFKIETPTYYASQTSQEKLMPTGFPVIDEVLHRGICRTDFICWLGGAKGKKSWGMGYLGRTALLSGLKILHISHELSAEDTEMRYDRILGGLTNQEDPITLDFPEHDYEGKLITTKSEKVKSVWDIETIRSIRRQARRFGGDLIIKKYPNMSCTMDEIERYLDYLELHENFVPDIVINDYIEKMGLPFGPNRRDYIHEAYMQSKRIAEERKLAMFTVSQVNRAALDKGLLDKSDFAEDIRKLDSVDLVLAVSANKAQARQGRMQAWVLANRHGADHFGCVFTNQLDAGQLVVSSWPLKFDEDDDDI